MNTVNRSLILCCVLNLLSACSEESKEPEKATTQVIPDVITNVVPEANTKSVEHSIKQQFGELEQSLQNISSTLDTVSADYEKNFNVDKAQVNKLAKQLGQLARQAGEGAKTLEETGKTFGDAIQEGFNEGYNK